MLKWMKFMKERNIVYGRAYIYMCVGVMIQLCCLVLVVIVVNDMWKMEVE